MVAANRSISLYYDSGRVIISDLVNPIGDNCMLFLYVQTPAGPVRTHVSRQTISGHQQPFSSARH